MSFLIAVYVNEGIVLASDRRSTYTNTVEIDGRIIQRIGIHTTNSTDKTFLCPNGAGISTCGDASLKGKPITGYIQDMIRTRIDKGTRIDDIPQSIIDYFYAIGDVPNTNFIVAGYQDEEGYKKQSIYIVRIKNRDIIPIDTTNQGASWEGEGLTLTRLLNNVALLNENGNAQILPYEPILFEYFTLQDAVDFARYAVETTIKTMRFKNVVETVGGEVDILVITPDETKWLQKAELK